VTPLSIGLVPSVAVTVAVPLLAALYAFSSTDSRVRGLRGLKTLRRTRHALVRRPAGEPLAQRRSGGVFGRSFGFVLCVAGFAAVGAFGPALLAPPGLSVLAAWFGLALLGGLAARTAGALRAPLVVPVDRRQIRNTP